MFLSIQFPITDLRTLLGNTNKLIKPTWSNPDIASELRYFGTIAQRIRGGILQWPGEAKYCNASNSINLKELTRQTITVNNNKMNFEGIFRRFYKPGEFTCKYEIALSHKADDVVNNSTEAERVSGVYDRIIQTTLDSFLKLDVKILKASKNISTQSAPVKAKADKQYTELQLHLAGSKLAELFLKGSTKGKFFSVAKKWWVVAGEPLAILSYQNTGKVKIPANAMLVDDIKEHGILLHSIMHPVAKNKFVRCWLIGLDVRKKNTASVEFLKQLNTNLLRVNAEKESLRHVLNTISANNFLLEDIKAKNFLSNFLEDATSNLLKKVRFGIEQDTILYFALKSEALATPGTSETLLNQLKPLENIYILRNIEKLATPEKRVIKIFIASSAEVKKEREKCIHTIFKVGKTHQHLILEPVLWEYDMAYANYPEYENIQAAIDPKLKDCKLVFFIFYSKIGQHTKEEYDYAIKEKKRISIFFKKGFSPSGGLVGLYNDLITFKQSLNETNLYNEYKGMINFDSLLTDNLHSLLSEEYPRPLPISPRLT